MSSFLKEGGTVLFYPSLDDVKILAKNFNVIPVSMEMHADMETPISIFKRFEDSKYCFLLESVEGGEKWARYSFIGKKPFLSVKSTDGKSVCEFENGTKSEFNGNPIDILESILSKYRGAVLKGVPRFSGGAVGFFSYDLARYYEKLPGNQLNDIGLPESHFMFADEVIVFDHLKQKIRIIANLHVDGNLEAGYNSTVEKIRDIYNTIHSSRSRIYDFSRQAEKCCKVEVSYRSNMTSEAFCRNVERAKQYIKDGDVFQVVLSQRFEAETSQDPFNIYRSLRIVNPSPYMYYLKFDGYSLIGASPEMLVRVEDGKAETCPIAGTRKRGVNENEDTLLEQDLLSDEKETAEHTMLVDLGRNDIGKVSRFGTVVVKDLMHVEKYSHVMHMVTNVQGELKEGVTPFEALAAVLPAGTVSGAPKVRAMEIIDELETTKRGPYAGAIGYLSYNGNLDSCITIRTLVFKNNKVYIQAGAGIVADSVPEREYEETLNKAKALFKALEEVSEIQ